MVDYKELFYHFLKNIHYQTEYLHFIYRNTNRATMQQRKANFWRGAQVPSIFVAILNVYIIFLTQNWLIGGLTFLVSIITCYFIGSWIYNHKIKNTNKLEEEKMNFNTTLIFIQNSRDQIEIIDNYKIEGMDKIKISKVDELEGLIEKDLCKVFMKFDGKLKIEIEDFLDEFSMDIPRFKGRLERLREFMKEKSVDYDNKVYYKNLNIMIEFLEVLGRDNEPRAKNLLKNFFKEEDKNEKTA